MNKLLATLIAGLFATSVYAQTQAAEHQLDRRPGHQHRHPA